MAILDTDPVKGWLCGGTPPWYPAAGEVVLLISQSGAAGSSVFTDTAKNHAITPTGAVWTDAQKLFGKNTIRIDMYSYLKVTNVADMALATGQSFCVEFWYKPLAMTTGSSPTGENRNLFGFPTTTNANDLNSVDGLGCYATDAWNGGSPITHLSMNSHVGTTGINITNSTDLTANWNHIAITRDYANNVRIFVNGVLKRTAVISSAVTAASGIFYVGAGGGSGGTNRQGNGYFAEFRFTKGSHVYFQDFTPPGAFLT